MKVLEVFIAYIDASHEVMHFASDDDATEETWAEALARGVRDGVLNLRKVNPHEPSDQHPWILNTKHVTGFMIVGLETLDTDTEDPLV